VLVISNFNDVISNYNVDKADVNDKTSIVNVHKSVVEVHKTGFVVDETGVKEKISRKGLLQMKRLHSNVSPVADVASTGIPTLASHERSSYHTRT
jgi:hypothetical protein